MATTKILSILVPALVIFTRILQAVAFAYPVVPSFGMKQSRTASTTCGRFIGARAVRSDDDNEEALGVLVFSSRGAEAEINRDLKTYDMDFREWLETKAASSSDEDESEALESIADMIFEAHQNVATKATENSRPAVDEVPSIQTVPPPSPKAPVDVLTAMRDLQSAANLAANDCNVKDVKFRDMKRRERNIGAS